MVFFRSTTFITSGGGRKQLENDSLWAALVWRNVPPGGPAGAHEPSLVQSAFLPAGATACALRNAAQRAFAEGKHSSIPAGQSVSGTLAGRIFTLRRCDRQTGRRSGRSNAVLRMRNNSLAVGPLGPNNAAFGPETASEPLRRGIFTLGNGKNLAAGMAHKNAIWPVPTIT
jgi:hypothetical protein